MLLSCPLLCTQGSPRAVPVPASTGTSGKGRRRSHEAVPCQSSRAECPHPRQILGAKRLKLCPGLTKTSAWSCLWSQSSPTREAGWREAAPRGSPVQHHPAAPASLQQHPACLARGQDALHLPSTHTAPRLQNAKKSSLPQRYASPPAEKTPPAILQRAHAAARNSHCSTWLQHWRPARGSHATAGAS